MRKTSLEAYESIGPDEITDLQRAILDLLQACPMTDADLIRRIQETTPGRSDSSIRTRRSELVAGGLVQDSGHWERSESGRRMIVWAVKDNGMRPNPMPGRGDRYVSIAKAREQAIDQQRAIQAEDDRKRLKGLPYLVRPPRVAFGQRLCSMCNATGGDRLDGPCWACGGTGVR